MSILLVVPFPAVFAIMIRPWLWSTAIGAVFALAPRRWWTRRPYLPIPDGDVVHWRIAAAYGSGTAKMTSDDVVSYLEWRRVNST